jgi:cytochrome c-type biogenesis protein CcmH/NrfG
MAHDAERVTESPLLNRPAIRLPRFSVHGALLVVLVLPLMLWASRTVTGVSSVLPRSSTPAADPPRRTEKPLQFASALPEAGEAPSHKRLLLGHALLAAGDTAGAVAAFAQAAQGDSRGALAWNAAETLARLPGHSASAADAYILAYAAGLPADRAETVARAQELAGRPDRARRVRDQSVAR